MSFSVILRASLLSTLLASLTAVVGAQTNPAAGELVLGAGPRPDLAGLVAAPVLRQSFHSFCPFPVAQPSLTWVDRAEPWAALLKAATVQPPPYAERDFDAAAQRLVIVAAAERPGPGTVMEVLKAPLAVAYNPASRRLSLRVVERDSPAAPGMLTAAVVGQPCLVLWLRFTQPVQEVLARNTRDQLLGRQILR